MFNTFAYLGSVCGLTTDTMQTNPEEEDWVPIGGTDTPAQNPEEDWVLVDSDVNTDTQATTVPFDFSDQTSCINPEVKFNVTDNHFLYIEPVVDGLDHFFNQYDDPDLKVVEG